MKNFLLSAVCFIVIASGVGYIFKAPLWDFIKDKITADMFVQSDTDSFDPGLPVGSQFPDIRAFYQGREVSTVREFVHDKGMVFIANRSADW